MNAESAFRTSILSYEQDKLEIFRPHGCGRLFNYLIEFKLYACIDNVDLKERSVLDVCCGSGIDAEFLAGRGARVIVLDYDAEGLRRTYQRAKEFNFQVKGVIGNALALPFEDRSIPICFVNDGLHHLKDPHRGIAELFRVAKDCVIISEPARSFLTRIAVRLGLSVDYEVNDDNFVYRFTSKELIQEARKHNFLVFKVKRFLLWHPHFPPKWFFMFDHPALFYPLKWSFLLVNLLFGRWAGNKIVFVAFRKVDHAYPTH